MGHGLYSTISKTARDNTRGLTGMSTSEVFKQTSLKNDMDPKNITMREARDSDEHPNSMPIIIGLDVTGSMGFIPDHLVREGLPKLVSRVIESGEPDPQILFLGVGDHKTDRAPLQVGQFESSDELLDKWLEDVYLEGNGGGNGGESYMLAWYFAANFTSTDSLEKRDKKGFLFTIGDEAVHDEIPEEYLRGIMGGDIPQVVTKSSHLLSLAREKYNVYHVHVKETWNGRNQHIIDGWKEIMGDNLLMANDHKDIPRIISQKIAKVSNMDRGTGSTTVVITNDSECDGCDDCVCDEEEVDNHIDEML